MQVGDLVKRKPEWGDWVKHNPWMYTEKDFEIGIIVEVDKSRNGTKANSIKENAKIFRVLIGGRKKWHAKNELELVSESR